MTSPEHPANDRRSAVAIGALVLVSFPLVFLGFKSFVVRDFAVFGYPLALYHKTAFWSGSLPLWNPLSLCGIPHLAQWNTLLLYPGSLLYLLLPLPWSLNLFCLLHLALGGIGMARLARSLTGNASAGTLAGVAHAFGGLSLTALMWPNNIAALGLLPWVVLAVRRATREGGRGLVGAILVGACQMLAGAPEIILATWILTGALLLCEARGDVSPAVIAGRLTVVILLIALVSAAQLLPFFELLGFADRPGHGNMTGWSASPSCWVNFLIPGYQSIPAETGYPLNHFQKWTLSFYPGMPVLVCAAFALARREPRALILGGLALGGVALASGHYSAAYNGLARFLPLDLMRFPVKFVLFPVLILPLLAALGWTRLQNAKMSRARLAVTGFSCLLIFGVAVLLDQTSSAARPERPDKWIEAAQRGTFLAGALLVLTLRKHFAALTPWLLVGLLWLDLRWHQPGIVATVPCDAYETSPTEADPPERLHITHAAWSGLYGLGSPDAAADLREHMAGRSALLNLTRGEAHVGGFLSLTSPRMDDVLGVINGSDWRLVNERMADFVGVRRLGHWRNDRVEWEHRDTAAPLITSGQRPFFADGDTQLERMQRPDFDPFSTVCLDPGADGFFPTNPTPARLTLDRFSSHEIRFTARTEAPSLAVVTHAWYPAWKARVNGQPVALHRADLLFQAIALPAGESEIVLRYEDARFRLGLALSCLGLLLTGLLWRRGSARPPDDHAPGVGEGERPVPGQ